MNAINPTRLIGYVGKDKFTSDNPSDFQNFSNKNLPSDPRS